MSSIRQYQPLLNQVVQIQIKDHPGSVSGVITNFPTDQFVVRFPQHAQLPAPFVPGMAIRVKCADAIGLHVAATVVDELCAPPRPGIVVRMPTAFDLVQNRRFFRVEVDFPCSVQAVDPSGAPLAAKLDAQAHIRDISAGGARLCSSCALALGDHVQVEFVPQPDPPKPGGTTAPGPAHTAAKATPQRPIRPMPLTPAIGVQQTCPVNAPKMQLWAKVVRVIPSTEDAPGSVMVGLEFERLSNRAQDRLVTLIFDVQRLQANRR